LSTDPDMSTSGDFMDEWISTTRKARAVQSHTTPEFVPSEWIHAHGAWARGRIRVGLDGGTEATETAAPPVGVLRGVGDRLRCDPVPTCTSRHDLISDSGEPKTGNDLVRDTH
jgi:hypothetical protein